MIQNGSTDIDKYISAFPAHTQTLLNELRELIMQAAPGGEEIISYKMPAYTLNGVLVWYAAYKNHIGLYPTPFPIKIFKDQLSEYKTSKGAIQFPIDKPLPHDLIIKIVQLRAKENLEKINLKKKSKINKK